MATITTIEQAFRDSKFTQTPGYRQYVHPDAGRVGLRASSVKDFLNNPELLEPAIMMDGIFSMEDVAEADTLYQRLLDELMAVPPQERTPEAEALIDKIIKKIGELFRYEELLLALGSTALADQEEHRRMAAELSLEFIGGIDRQSFGLLVNELLAIAARSDRSEAKELLTMLAPQEVAEEGGEIIGVSDEAMRVVHHDIRSLYPGIAQMMDQASPNPVDVGQAVDICNKVIEAGGLSDEWRAELDAGKSARTDIAAKTVYYGKDRELFPSEMAAISVAFHEAVVHGGRGTGPGDLAFEEGLATCLEQVITGKRRVPGSQYYLSIGLQAGVDRDGNRRNYREVFEIMWRREVLLMEQKGEEIDIQKARSDAQRQVHRTRRGGAIDTRDSSYFLGAQKASSWLNRIAELSEHERQAQLRHVLTHRYDPTNPEHVAYYCDTVDV